MQTGVANALVESGAPAARPGWSGGSSSAPNGEPAGVYRGACAALSSEELQTLSNDFFVNLTDMAIEWVPSTSAPGEYEGKVGHPCTPIHGRLSLQLYRACT